MNIILLSGGSGSRLWPLSNDIRSKQFIQLFREESGDYESMVQRVHHQITSVAKDAKITIATSKTQVSAIRNQLGDKVSLCIEPYRRDTFPAIALAAAYLHDELSVSLDECVVVCPVDPYVDNSYFEAVDKLQNLVDMGTANLTLMGIEPTYPSEKYGYIIPETTENTSFVKEFKEKPDRETAEDYLAKSALWNAGVFAFKLGYLLDKVHNIVGYSDYYNLYKKYDALEKISFDYAVVEKESSIQVVRYAGEWKDVGTWNTMSEVMAETTKGNVLMDDTCENTHVINELNIPILCMGLKDLVVAASSDGILVSEKERSGYMKPYVEKVSDSARFAEKSWGTFRVMDIQAGVMTVINNIDAGHQMKYHSHEKRNEVWTIASGIGKVIVDGTVTNVCTGDVVSIAAGMKHTIVAETDMTIIEVQIGKEISERDKKVFELENSDEEINKVISHLKN